MNMRLVCGLAVVALLLRCGGGVAAQKPGNSARFSWLDFFKGQNKPSTPAIPTAGGGGADGQANADARKNSNLFDEIQMANDILELENELLDQEEYERRVSQGTPRKLPADMFCKKEQKEALKTFCTHMKEGYYYDPWNPFCGFIRCRLVESADRKPRMVATRELCREGTWVSDQSQRMRHGRDNICRVALEIDISDGDLCMGGAITRSSNMCEPAKRVLHMNDKTAF